MTGLMTLAAENGFSLCAPVCTAALVPLGEVRAMCEADRCGKYGKNWACPPGCGSIEQARARISRYDSGVLVQTTGTLADEFDYEGMQAIARHHKKCFENFARQARLLYPGCLPLTAGACTICARCTGQALPVSRAAAVVHGGLRPVGQRYMCPLRTAI